MVLVGDEKKAEMSGPSFANGKSDRELLESARLACTDTLGALRPCTREAQARDDGNMHIVAVACTHRVEDAFVSFLFGCG